MGKNSTGNQLESNQCVIVGIQTFGVPLMLYKKVAILTNLVNIVSRMSVEFLHYQYHTHKGRRLLDCLLADRSRVNSVGVANHSCPVEVMMHVNEFDRLEELERSNCIVDYRKWWKVNDC